MASFSEASRASQDPDLTDRFEAAAAAAGVPNPRVWVSERMRHLAAAPISAQGQTVADVYTYADTVRKGYLADDRALPPGANPGAVTDLHIEHAVAHVLGGVAS